MISGILGIPLVTLTGCFVFWLLRASGRVEPYKRLNSIICRGISLPFTGLPCVQDTGGGNPHIDTQDVLKLLIVGDSAVRLLVTLGARST
jgi:hypothetical protein